MQIKPARIIALSFLAVIAVGTLLLFLPFAAQEGRISFMDAFFTAASATCVTGLIVKDTGTFFSPFGKYVIMILFQLGGLGIMTFSTIFALVLGRRISIQNRKALSLVFENIEFDIKVLLRWIFIFTFIIEGIGVLLLKLNYPELTLFSAAFHSISAFCNAGFSLFAKSFQGFRSDIPLNLIITTLIISGGVGFLVLYDLARLLNAKARKKEARLAVHTKIVLVLTLILIISGSLFIFFSEKSALFENYELKSKLLVSYFQSVSARTAGFNTVAISALRPASKVFLSMLMFIGASPGSTGGGIKTVSFALIIVGIIMLLKGRNQIHVFRRAIPLQLFEKAIVIVLLGLAWIFIATVVMLFTEKETFLNLLFEVVSAFGTVGLSCIETGGLTVAGKAIIILTMFLGRIGPMTLAIALSGKEEGEFKLPEESVMVG